MTQRLYDDSTITEFSARVVSCVKNKNYYEIILDRSAFFPEGGGQAGDVGLLGEYEVIDTFERNGEVIHKCTAPLQAGSEIRGKVNENTRLRRMQNHSGEHLLMGFIHNKFGFDNVGFHMGSSGVTLDINGVLGESQLLECELLANRAIAMDLPITVSYPDSDDLTTIDYRSKLEMTENVRLVTIQGVDVCACCAPHVSSTGKIGIVKVLSSENYKGGTRLQIICGLDALETINSRFESVAEISRLLSAKSDKIFDYVQKLYDDNNTLKRKLYLIDKQRTDEIIGNLKNTGSKSICVFVPDLSREFMREIANSAAELTEGIAGVFSSGVQGYSYVIASNTVALKALSGKINSALKGKGGGSDKMLEGSAYADREAVKAFFESFTP